MRRPHLSCSKTSQSNASQTCDGRSPNTHKNSKGGERKRDKIVTRKPLTGSRAASETIQNLNDTCCFFLCHQGGTKKSFVADPCRLARVPSLRYPTQEIYTSKCRQRFSYFSYPQPCERSGKERGINDGKEKSQKHERDGKGEIGPIEKLINRLFSCV